MPTPKTKTTKKSKSPNGTKSAKNKPHLTQAERNKYNRQVMQGRVERGASHTTYKYGGSRKHKS